MFFRIFKLLIITFFVFILLFSASVFYITKIYLKNDDIKNYISEILYEKTQLFAVISTIGYTYPEKIEIKGIKIIEKNKELFNINELELTIDFLKLLRQLKLEFKMIKIKNSNINLYIKNGELEIKKYFYSEKKSKIPEIIIKDSYINIKDKDTNYSAKIYIKEFSIYEKFIIPKYDIAANFEYEDNNIKKININAILKSSKDFNEIEIERFQTSIKEKKIQIDGELNLKQLYFKVKLSTNQIINLKDFINISKNIYVDKFSSNLNINRKNNDIFIIEANISEIKTSILIEYNFKTKTIEYAKITTQSTDLEKVKEYINNYIKDFKGKVDMEIKVIKQKNKNSLYITAYTSDISFKDLYDMFKFKNSKIKFIINPSFHALNAIELNATFPYGKITGNLRTENDSKKEKIIANFKLNNISVISNIQINDIPNNRNYIIDLKTSEFRYNDFLNIFNYVNDKLNKNSENRNSIYNMKNKPVVIKWNSDNLTDNPYINASKLIIKADIKDFNSYNLIKGNFKIRIINGKMEKIQENAQKSEIYRIIFLPLTTIFTLNRMGALRTTSSLETININDLGVDFDLNNGKIVINKLYVDSKEFLIYAKGKLNISTKQIDMESYIINRKDYKSGALSETLTDAKGRPAISFTIKGSFDKYDLKILDSSNITQIVEKEIKEKISIN